MSCLPEAKLAREAELAYVMVCMATDYDCWRDDEAGEAGEAGESVTVEMVNATMRSNAENARRFVAAVLDEMAAEGD
ncbi:S-methyl-5-thioadenosine phosphorylase, partial [Ascosphaera acerosa]